MPSRETRLMRSTLVLLRRVALASLVAASVFVIGCGSKAATPAAACDQACIDGVALRSLRTTMKLAFNLTLQGKPVGQEDGMTPCPMGGTAHVYGTASSNPIQGATMVDLTYDFVDCQYAAKDDMPEKTYHLSITGTVYEKGTLAVQPSATTAIVLSGESVSLSGTVFDPPATYMGSSCAVIATQDGNALTGKLCGRDAHYTF